jgi:hypothetical protein
MYAPRGEQLTAKKLELIDGPKNLLLRRKKYQDGQINPNQVNYTEASIEHET